MVRIIVLVALALIALIMLPQDKNNEEKQKENEKNALRASISYLKINGFILLSEPDYNKEKFIKSVDSYITSIYNSYGINTDKIKARVYISEELLEKGAKRFCESIRNGDGNGFTLHFEDCSCPPIEICCKCGFETVDNVVFAIFDKKMQASVYKPEPVGEFVYKLKDKEFYLFEKVGKKDDRYYILYSEHLCYKLNKQQTKIDN